MGDAGKALKGQNFDRATEEQTLALDQLRKGAQSLAKQLMQQMGRRFGQNQRDPLGRTRQTQGPDFGGDVKVPDEIDIQQARKILQELRRRYSEPGRPSIELDYLERLLKRFLALVSQPLLQKYKYCIIECICRSMNKYYIYFSCNPKALFILKYSNGKLIHIR